MNLESETSCIRPQPLDTLTDRLNNLLHFSGPGFIISLCPGEHYPITAPLQFAAPNQEIRTVGYPTGSTRAILVVDGPIINGTGHTTAVDGTCDSCDGVKLRNVQIDGNRRDRPLTKGGANIEMGSSNANQLVEYVRSYDPRGWSCLHVAQGNLDCTNTIIRHNDIGPAGSSEDRQWADGISVACRNSVVRDNSITDVTDGGIVLFGALGTIVDGNTVRVEKKILLGGINMVDFHPFRGDYEGVVVTRNTIIGGFSSLVPQGSKTKGPNEHGSVIKIGIAIGPRTWFGEHYGNNVSAGGIVKNNRLTGAFSYGIAINSVKNFTVEGNVLLGNTSFIGHQAPNCTSDGALPSPAAFVADLSNVYTSTVQSNFRSIDYSDSLVNCVEPPRSGNYWPYSSYPHTTAPAIDFTALGYDRYENEFDSTTILLALFGMMFITCIIWCGSVIRDYVPALYPRHSSSHAWQKVHDPLSSLRRPDPYVNIS